MKLLVLLSQLLLCEISLTEEITSKINNRPTIAILAQLLPTDIHNSYIAASYVKFIESAGGRAVLIPTSMDQTEVKKLFSYVNGVLFPGGGVRWFTSGYYKHAKTFYDLAIEANNKGDYFPVWGTCLGFQTLHVLTTNDSGILSKFAADDISMPLNFTKEARKSRLFSPDIFHVYNMLAIENITYNHHNYGISPEIYNSHPVLANFYKILSTNRGKNGKEFVSMIEARDYPFYGSQWHPEKNNFEFNTDEHIPHIANAVIASLYMANFFIGEARNSFHQFPSAEEAQKYLSYNYNPSYSGKHGSHFEQIYLFPA